MSTDLTEELGRNIPLYEMIQTLRQELAAAARPQDGHSLHLRVDEITLDLAIEVTKSSKGGGGLKFWVVQANASGESHHKQTHRFTLKLTPQWEEGDLMVSDRLPGHPA